jgi:membrane associated rhomboid family serine protease
MSFGIGGGLTPWVKGLLIANTVAFLLQNSLPGLTQQMQFVPDFGYILTHPWTVVTYMFAHGGFGHLFFNMLALFFFGPPLEARWGSREFMKYYIICGLGGAALSFAFTGSPIIGASAAVYGVMLAFAMNWPDAPIYIWAIFPVPAKYLVGIFVLISLFSAFGNANDNVAHFAHLGGFAAGFIYLKLDHHGGGLFTRARRMMKGRKLDVQSGGGSVGGTGRASGVRIVPGGGRQPAGGVAAMREEHLLNELDRVLDKISTEGMNSLTSEERRLLDEASRRHRQN